MVTYIRTMALNDPHSRIVLWLKISLPLLALTILSTMFLVAETHDPEAAIPYADVDVEQALSEQGMTRPEFGGITSNGVIVSLGAGAVRPAGSAFRGTDLVVQMTLPDGGVIDVTSPEGTIDLTDQSVVLDGGVQLNSTSGYEVTTETVRAGWSVTMLETDGTVDAVGPAGVLKAGKLSLAERAGGAGHVLVFKDGVRLIYRPGA